MKDAKTGARRVPLTPAVEAAQLLAGIPGVPDTFVIAGRAGQHVRSLNGPWEKVRAQAGLRDVRLHDLRHSFASRALALGETLPAIGRRAAASGPRLPASAGFPAGFGSLGQFRDQRCA